MFKKQCNLIKLVEQLKLNHLTISSCESFTGGLFASLITEVSGSSEVFKGSFVSYAPTVKEKVVGVKSSTIETYGTVSYECSREMAVNTKKWMDTDISVSFTGVAGPNPSEGKEVGTVFMYICFKDQQYCLNRNYDSTLSREEIRRKAILEVQQFIIDLLKK